VLNQYTTANAATQPPVVGTLCIEAIHPVAAENDVAHHADVLFESPSLIASQTPGNCEGDPR
jgi:hypothetical protein